MIINMADLLCVALTYLDICIAAQLNALFIQKRGIANRQICN